jgi:hypothetical protein
MALDCLFAEFSGFVLPPFEPNGSGALRQPPNTPVVREAPQAPRSLTEQKRDIEPSESVHVELVVFCIGS